MWFVTARQAIEQCSNPMLKLRPLYEGTQNSKLKARRNVDFLQPYKERPKTTKLVANRLVAGALGMRSKMSKEERQLEREKIKAERERKVNKEKQKKDLWESDDL
ncbi:coiled-coil domain-containing R3HCC1L [Paramuricea clavata]|uniref:Coiled-coil domain-containing R3HCC1L n=1 Tax=Paramuricea clavata TaxID=317549 RepID=A0A6S7KHD9_PARCT|nr:coiled-coil domain-containing R3HCC1L [Paramuricea clavata]